MEKNDLNLNDAAKRQGTPEQIDLEEKIAKMNEEKTDAEIKERQINNSIKKKVLDIKDEKSPKVEAPAEDISPKDQGFLGEDVDSAKGKKAAKEEAAKKPVKKGK